MKVSSAILLAGIVLVLSGPLIALTPTFTPPPNGFCPCPVSYPFGDAGIIAEMIGIALILCGGVRRGLKPTEAPLADLQSKIVAITGFALLVLSSILSQIDLTGPTSYPLGGYSYVIVLYGGQAFYLEMLGIGMLLFAGFAFITRKRASSLFLAIGIVLSGISLFVLLVASSVSVATTISENPYVGYLLATGSFLLGLGLWLSRRKGRKGKTSVLSPNRTSQQSKN